MKFGKNTVWNWKRSIQPEGNICLWCTIWCVFSVFLLFISLSWLICSVVKGGIVDWIPKKTKSKTKQKKKNTGKLIQWFYIQITSVIWFIPLELISVFCINKTNGMTSGILLARCVHLWVLNLSRNCGRWAWSASFTLSFQYSWFYNTLADLVQIISFYSCPQ